MAIYIPNQIHQYGLPGAQRVLGFVHIQLRKGVSRMSKELLDTLQYSSMCYFPHFLFPPSGAGTQLQLYAHVHLPCTFLVNTIEQMCMLDTNGQSKNMNFCQKDVFRQMKVFGPIFVFRTNIWFLEHPGSHHQAKKQSPGPGDCFWPDGATQGPQNWGSGL